jgi:hypothetical protein
MEFDDVLNKERETALNYYKGSMPDLSAVLRYGCRIRVRIPTIGTQHCFVMS